MLVATLRHVGGCSKRSSSRVIDFRAGVDHHGRAAAAVSAGDEHFTVLEKGRRVALAWRAQAAGCRETTRSRIVQLRAGEK